MGTGLLLGNDHLATLQTVVALVGKFSATCTFGNMYVYTGELYPTAIRNTSIGSCSTVVSCS